MVSPRQASSSTGAASDAVATTTSAAAEARSTIARLALVGKAMLHGIFALLAINIATNSGSATTTGAIENLARDRYGQFLLIALTAGLLALVAWKALQAIAGDPVDGSDLTDRATYGLTGASYATVAVAAVTVLVANWGGPTSPASGGGNGKEEATATVLAWPGGQWLVVAGGLLIAGFGAYELYRNTVRAAFLERLDTSSLDPNVERSVEIAGRSGYAVRSVTTILVGCFLVVAGVQHDPDETKGLSGVLQELAATPWGGALLWMTAIGLFLYGLFTLAEAKLRRST